MIEDHDTDWLIDEEAPRQADQHGAGQPLPPWRVLIVDDDVDVHVVTKFSLSNASFLGRRLSFLHAYSGAEALSVLRSTPDVALVLLDVIMESHDAGLQTSRQIRDELGNHLVRIVLRTGQPGQALEHSIILDYDINDFWCKTDLTNRKLFTTVIASLRTYASLLNAQQRITALTAALQRSGDILLTLEQHTLLLKLDSDDAIADASAALCAHLGYRREQLVGENLARILSGAAAGAVLAGIHATLAAGATWAGDLSLLDNGGAQQGLRATIMPFDAAQATATPD